MDLVFSDIHADVDGLNTILDIAFSKEFETKYGKISRIINLGDLLERGTTPSEVLSKMKDLSKSYSVISVMGNHDEGYLYGKYLSGSSYESQKAHMSLTEQDLEFFKQNKDGTYGSQFVIDQKNKLLLVHGGPLDPQKITQNGDDPWLYQRTWQRLSEENNEFFSYYGYHYKPSSAFEEARTYFDDFVILCGHQHVEAAIKQNNDQVTNIWSFHANSERISNHKLDVREFPIEPKNNYIFRVGLGGPQGDHKGNPANTHFGLIQDDPKKILLFRVQ